MPAPSLESVVAPAVLAAADDHARAFAGGDPFRHVVIEDFFEAGFAARLLATFPPFTSGNARNENGVQGNKSTIERIRGIDAAYATLDDLVCSAPFLDLVGRITGIDDLLYDPWYFGGGTHENRSGQELDPHIDFNRHPVEKWHRRLNLIVYLNHDWHDEWGGVLELHSDPRAADDRIRRIGPAFNRCVIFETTESSWHGFDRIVQPEGAAALARKSIALYFYTVERPAAELGETHSTIYVDRPLPERFREGRVLDAADVDALQTLLARRDQHNQRLYAENIDLGAQLAAANAALMRGFLTRVMLVLRRVHARLRR